MAVLIDADRLAGWRRIMERGFAPPTILKTDLRAALNAVDDQVDANVAVLNLWFPQPFRGQATPAEKAILLAMVFLKRAGVSL